MNSEADYTFFILPVTHRAHMVAAINIEHARAGNEFCELVRVMRDFVHRPGRNEDGHIDFGKLVLDHISLLR